jgi:hypothetical protein
MRPRLAAATLSLALLPLLAVGCGAEPETGEAPPADDEATAVGAPEPRAARIEVSGFSTPESVLHDPVADVYLVSNIQGSPLDADDNGFISRVSPDGTLTEARWVDGAGEDVTLNAPKGMAILGDTLYVADIDCVRMFVRTTGAPAGSVCIEGATFLNDIAVDGSNVLHVTDTGMQAGAEGFAPSGTDAVHRFSPDGQHAALVEGEALGNPNGIAFGDQGGFVVTFGTGEIYRLEADGGRTPVLPPSQGRQLDGIAFTADGGFLFSSWGDSSVHLVQPDGTVVTVVDGVQAPADIGYDATRNRVLVPLFMDDAILIVELPAPEAGPAGGA